MYDKDKITFSRNHKGYDAYLQAVKYGHIGLMKHLIRVYGWNYRDTKNEHGDTEYLIAAKNGHYEIMRHIEIYHKPDINYKNNFGCNVYLFGAMSLELDIITYIESKYDDTLDFNIKSNNGLDAHDVAMMSYVKYDDHDDEAISYLGKRKFQNKFELTKSDNHELDNDTCVVCCEKFKKDDIYCKCIHEHVIHRDCYVDYLILNNSDVSYKCVYCKLEVPEKSYKLP